VPFVATSLVKCVTVRSEYLEWVKTRKPARFNLAHSGVTPCAMSELGVCLDDLEVNGPGLYGYQPLQEAIAHHCGVPPDCVVATSGTSMANFLAMAALIRQGDEVLIEQPAYEPLPAVARYLGAEIKRFQRRSPEQINVSNRTKLIVVTNLHNPTCTRLDESELQRLAHLARDAGARVLVDEVYLECMYEKTWSAFHLGHEFVCTGSLTKAYGLGGLRCGWILAAPDLARRIWQLKDLVDPSAAHPSERLSVIAFQRLNLLAERAKAILETNRKLFRHFLPSCPQLALDMPDYGTCVFPRVHIPEPSRLFQSLPDEFETDVVPGRFFEQADHCRIGIGVETTIFAEGLQRLRKALM
jgi:aspartate/methionine/tyrosine aminotransferase